MSVLSLTQFPEKEQQLIQFLQSKDLLRFRSKFETAIDSLLNQEFPKKRLSYQLYQITNLSLKETNTIARELFATVLSDDFLQQAATETVEDTNSPAQEVETSVPRRSRKILDLKDMFEAGGNSEDELPVVESGDDDIESFRQEMAHVREKDKQKQEQLISKVVDSITISLSEEQQKKVRDIIASRVKNIRDAVDTRLALSRSIDEGGLGLSGGDASEISVLIENTLREKDSFESPTTEAESNEVSILEKNTIKQQEGRVPQKEIEDMFDRTTQQEDTVGTQQSEGDTKSNVVTPEQKIQAQQPKKTQPPQEPFLDPIPRKEADVKDRVTPSPIVPGIAEKKKAGLIGPIEELREITIEDWRALFKSAEEGAADVKNKLKVLKEESFEKMIKGVQAWKKGNIVKLYIEIGGESAADRVSIQENADARKAEGKSYLTETEFHAIMDLNKELRSYSL